MSSISMGCNRFALSSTLRSEQSHPRFGYNAFLAGQYQQSLDSCLLHRESLQDCIKICEARIQDSQEPNAARYSAAISRLQNSLKDLEASLRKGERNFRQRELHELMAKLEGVLRPDRLGINEDPYRSELDEMMGFSSDPPVKVEDLSTLQGMPAAFCNRVIAEINQDQARSRKSGHSGWWLLNWVLGRK